MEYRFQIGGDSKAVRIERSGDQYVMTIGDRTYSVVVRRAAPGEIAFTVDGQPRRAVVAEDGPHRYVAFDANVYTVEQADATRKPKRTANAGENNLAAAMHGQVIKVLAAEGDPITRGQPLLLLEAMKMEIRITAPHDGHIACLFCREGQVVERGQVLVELTN